MLEFLKDTLDKSVAAVSVKSESIVESSRVRTAMTTAQKNMDAAVNALGVKFYNSWLGGSVDMTELEAECEKIREMHTELTNLKAKLEQIKQEESQILGTKKAEGAAVFCTNCGKKLEPGVRFCDSCGTAVKS